MEYAEAIDNFLSKYEYLFGRVRGIEVLLCIIEVKEGDNKGYYNFYTRAYGVESTIILKPTPLEDISPLLRGGSRIELNETTNLLLSGWNAEVDTFFEWLKGYNDGKEMLIVPGEGDQTINCYFGTSLAFVDFEPEKAYYFQDYPYTAELRVPGDKETIAGVITEDAVDDAIKEISSRLKINLIEDTIPIYGGLDVIIPETRFAVEWRGAPPKNEKGFLLRFFEREPGLLKGANLVLRDRKAEKLIDEEHSSIDSTRIYIPGFIPEHRCEVTVFRDGITLYADENYLIKDFLPDICMMSGRERWQYTKKGLESPVEVEIVSSTRIRGPNPDKDYNTTALRAMEERAEKELSLFILEPNNRSGGIGKARSIIAKARSYIKIWDPYLNAFDLATLMPAIRDTDIEIRVLTGYRRPPSENSCYLLGDVERTKQHVKIITSRGEYIELELEEEKSKQEIKDNFQYLCNKAKSLRRKIRIKDLRETKYSYHDRFLIIDRQVWAVGTSFNNIGAEFSTIIKIDAGVIIESRFDEIWRSIEEEISTFG